MSAAASLKLKAQIICGGELALGPGKADLLEAIAVAGSISAAGRQLGYSYRRTWLMVDTMNRCWRGPLVVTVKGGPRGGGASLTPLGTRVLDHYRILIAALEAAACAPWATLAGDLLEHPHPALLD